ncbi:MAG: glycosyltransferase family 4 protein [Bacteroidales bacterium]|nr:glycosyltransferase family 4 protein [Bacteroidales bacterium]
MNILQIANKAIYPPDGGSMAILSLSKAYMRKGHQVHLLNMITHKHFNNYEIIESEYKDSLKISGVNINTQISFFKLLLNLLFSNKPYIAQRFVSKKFASKLINLLNNNSFDFIQIEGLYSLQYINTIRNIFGGNILYRPHNIEYQIWKRNYEETKSFIKRLYFNSLFKRLKKLEENLLNTYDFLIPISESDAKIYKELGNSKPVKTSTFGIDLKKIQDQFVKINLETDQSINYIGALDWIPNQEGLLWFIEHCFPEILKSFPQIKLNIAGRNAPKWLIRKFNHSNINFLGEVKNAYDFIQNPGPIIVPLFSGSGIRVKIIESMAFKKAIVATGTAAEGIDCLHNKNILLANNDQDFANSVISVLNNVGLQKEIGENAFKFVKEHYDFEKIATDILTFIKITAAQGCKHLPAASRN